MLNKAVLTHFYNLNPRPLLASDGSWVLLVNAKTATGSMTSKKAGLHAKAIHREHNTDLWHDIWHQYVDHDPHRIVFFTFVRNPWDRLVSAYHYLVQGSRAFAWETWPFERFVKEWLGTRPFSAKGIGLTLYRHIAPQHRTCYFNDHRIDEVFIGRFETIQHDWEQLLSLGVNGDKVLPQLRPSEHKPYQGYYNDKTRRIVRRLYRQDIERFGYKFT